MPRHEKLIEVVSKHDYNCVRAVLAWAKKQRGGIVCPKCEKLKRSIFPARIDVPLSELQRGTSYDVAAYFMIGVICERMLDFLSAYLPVHSLGDCVWEDGSAIPDYRSIYFRDYIMLRSGARSRNYNHNVCGTCGLVSSRSNDVYFLRSELPPAHVFQDAICCLYVSQTVAAVFPWKQFRDLKPVEIPIRDEPLADDPVPVRPYEEPKRTPLSDGKLAALAPLPYEPPEYEPRCPALLAMLPEFPRLAEDSARSCPVPMREITGYLRLEGELVRARDLTFVRTAEVDGRRCWLWRFAGSVRADCFVTVWVGPDGSATIGYRLNSDNLTPEQYIYGEHHGLL